MSSDLRPLTRALLSVSDKTGLIDFARALSARGIELVSTGGTSKAIADAGLKVIDVSDLTGFPEMMDGRVKTLHPKVHGGLLAIRENPEHEAAMLAHDIKPIDLLVVNLYPFEATIAKGAAYDECIENIDIGGPAMIRAADPHQAAGFYKTPEQRFGVSTARQVQGKTLSYNNVNDTDAAFECVAEFDPSRTAAVAIIKHANPCGVAEGASLLEAYEKALRCDPVSAFGGIVALNRKLDAAAAAEIVKIFTEVIIAPDADDEAIALIG
ncbi:MAG: bifunctional phosphoribosylaminoimidazolecarboxamide formyltransferase/inosine monophosphate cyclohydrolase, partial [Alphaproteobacteria bacterium]|nr:bifunctional phosphoribosylaminoimidazolecarboxamide formyltransferase/inosine monophosphate cyclohydrolase [Alphaproteobacteria bacterium]